MHTRWSFCSVTAVRPPLWGDCFSSRLTIAPAEAGPASWLLWFSSSEDVREKVCITVYRPQGRELEYRSWTLIVWICNCFYSAVCIVLCQWWGGTFGVGLTPKYSLSKERFGYAWSLGAICVCVCVCVCLYVFVFVCVCVCGVCVCVCMHVCV